MGACRPRQASIVHKNSAVCQHSSQHECTARALVCLALAKSKIQAEYFALLLAPAFEAAFVLAIHQYVLEPPQAQELISNTRKGHKCLDNTQHILQQIRLHPMRARQTLLVSLSSVR